MNPLPKLDPSDPKLEPVPVHKDLYWIIFGGTIATYLVLLLIAALTWNVTFLPYLNIGFPIVLLVVIHFFSSWGSVRTDEWAAFYFYGRALRELPPGPYFMPKGLMQIEKAPRGLQQRQAPGEPEQVFHGDDKDPLPPGMVRPIRITTRAPEGEEKGHLDVQMTFEWSFYYQFQIKNFFQFVSRVGNFDHAAQLIRDTGEAVLNEFASEMTVNGMIKNLKKINEELDNRIRALVNSWGMEIFEARALAPNLSHSLATALRNVPIARLEAEQAETRAIGERRKREEEGAGAAHAEAAMLKAKADGRQQWLTAEADGLKAKVTALGVSGEDVLAAEVASDAFANADSLMVGASDGVRDLLGVVKVGAAVFNASKGDKKE